MRCCFVAVYKCKEFLFSFSVGSRTPGGGATPLHDGSRTPGPWDPSSTPARSIHNDAYPMDDSFNNSYPHTPGTMYGSSSEHTSYSPLQASPSPSGYQSHSGVSSGSSSYLGATPSPSSEAAPYGTPSPLSYSSRQASPFTPGTGLDQYPTPEWHTTDIEVRINENARDPEFRGQIGVIRHLGSGVCSVYLAEEERTLSIEAHELEPVMPQPNDKVKVIVGEHKECTGVLLSVDNGEGVVKLTEEDDVKMIDVKFLCKYKPE
ncbi:transcription elongation factor SPT5 [Diaphorina citri]|uniref:Transcription elongation factor SPT5 n=1 Tax=Diaphorina citri TaxID=121845 RepID=A0A3Q0JLI8_DIACI|nr:transcription elongation factor SPT5 [Diaphorina citri]